MPWPFKHENAIVHDQPILFTTYIGLAASLATLASGKEAPIINLEHPHLNVRISHQGAELQSIVDKRAKAKILRNGDAPH